MACLKKKTNPNFHNICWVQISIFSGTVNECRDRMCVLFSKAFLGETCVQDQHVTSFFFFLVYNCGIVKKKVYSLF